MEGRDNLGSQLEIFIYHGGEGMETGARVI